MPYTQLLNGTTYVKTENLSHGHFEIHEGRSFTASNYQMVSDTNDKTAIGLLTPAGDRKIHMFARGVASAIGQFLIREGPTVTDNQGATQAVYNRYRDSATTSIVLDKSQNPDTAGAATYFAEADQAQYSEDGTLLFCELLAAGTGPKVAGGNTRAEGEFILKVSTYYLFYIKSLSNDDNYHSLVLDWYESTNP